MQPRRTAAVGLLREQYDADVVLDHLCHTAAKDIVDYHPSQYGHGRLRLAWPGTDPSIA